MSTLKKNVALIVPNKDLYSETFIRAHKDFLDANIFYYYGAVLPTHLEGFGKLTPGSWLERFSFRIRRRFLKLSYSEACFLFSLKRNSVEVVLAEYGMTGATVWGVCKRLDIPLFVFFHGLDASVYTILAQYKEQYLKMFSYATKVFVVSSVMRNKLLGLGCPEEKLVLNTYGPDESFFSVIPQFKSNNFLSVGRFVSKKAPYYTILAFSKVVNVYPDARLTMIGDGELLEICENLVKYLKIDRNVVFKGVASREEIQQLMVDSIGFLQHSIVAADGNSEGAPVGIIEASAAGLPVVSTLHAGIPDVIINNETGLLVNEHDVDAMGERIFNLIQDKTYAQAMGQKSRQRIREKFTMKRHIDLIQTYL